LKYDTIVYPLDHSSTLSVVHIHVNN